ncbi:MAG: hypothetical protein JNK64_15380 [Myxococcales bacterium]|nr:hypothetical protein [Myxococcales bacterium]
MARLLDLADAGADAGGKAHGLARLIAAGVPTPPGFVIAPAAFTALVGALPDPAQVDHGHALGALAEAARHAEPPAALAAEVAARAAALGPRIAVRSSLAIEDRAGGAAPGVGTSVVAIAPAEVWPAIRHVWSAAMLPLVAAYAARRGAATTAPPAVIVQRFVAGFRATIYTRPPGQPAGAEAWIACGPGAPVRVARDGAAWREALDLALAAERAIAAPDGADVELVWAMAERAWVVVQARPLVHPPPAPRRSPPPPIVLAPLRALPRRWRRDVTHNPGPLSVAQAELCARVEAAAIAPFHLRVVAHHLYWAPRPDAPPAPTVTDAAALAHAIADDEARIAAALAAPAASLDDALAIYLRAYQLLAGGMGPRVHAALAVLPAALAAAGHPPALAARLAPARPSSIASQLAACARGELDRAALLAAIGDAAPRWDVDAPTFAETPALIEHALATAPRRPPPQPIAAPGPGLDEAIAIARIAVDAAERDDLWYWRAQAVVRRALRALAAQRGLDPDDACWLPFARLLDDAPLSAETARGHASAARAAAARAAAWELPLSLDDPEAPPAATTIYRGAGIGGVVAGPVHHADDDDGPVPPGAVVVTRAVTPALALLIGGAAAIVSEHGSPLDHGAAMARELGIPCVVGCPGVTLGLAPRTWVEVDGDAGTVSVR